MIVAKPRSYYDIGTAIDTNTGLKTLDLSWNHLRGRGSIAIAKGLENNYSLHTLLLAWNGFGDEGACAVAKALLENNTLQELDLSNNRITKKGCLAFADTLKVNTSLRILRIGKNQIGEDGAHALLAAINSNAETGIEVLDMDGVVIEEQAQTLVSKFLRSKPQFDISCTFGKSGNCYICFIFMSIVKIVVNRNIFISYNKINWFNFSWKEHYGSFRLLNFRIL